MTHALHSSSIQDGDQLIYAGEAAGFVIGLPDGRIPATFEIITLTGWVPHESQQKPLAPGSAKVRLSDALKPKPDNPGAKE